MGFGILFIGYFLLLNVTYYEYTDLLAALIMMLALYKLASVNKPFKFSFFSSVIFAVLALFEMICAIVALFFPTVTVMQTVINYIGPARYVYVGFLTALILISIKEVSAEVGLKKLESQANALTYISSVVFALLAFISFPISVIPADVMAVLGFILLLASFGVMIINLVTIYTAYMRICMPDEKNDTGNRESKFGFVNKFKKHEEEKQREYAEYRLEKLKKKNTKRKK